MQKYVDVEGPLASPVLFLDSFVKRCINKGCTFSTLCENNHKIHCDFQCFYRPSITHGTIANCFLYTPNYVWMVVNSCENVATILCDQITTPILVVDFVLLESQLRATLHFNISGSTVTVLALTLPIRVTVSSDRFRSTFIFKTSSCIGRIGAIFFADNLKVVVEPIYTSLSLQDRQSSNADVCRNSLQQSPSFLTTCLLPIGPEPVRKYEQRDIYFALGKNYRQGTLLRFAHPSSCVDFLYYIYDDDTFPMEPVVICPCCLTPILLTEFSRHLELTVSFLAAHSIVVDTCVDGEWVARGSPVSACANRLFGGDVLFLFTGPARRYHEIATPFLWQTVDCYSNNIPVSEFPVYFGCSLQIHGRPVMVAVSYDQFYSNTIQCPMCGMSGHPGEYDAAPILHHLGLSQKMAGHLYKFVMCEDMRSAISFDLQMTMPEYLKAVTTQFI
jgi:hypothetical protein